jgi:acyl-CoA thioesterase
MQEDFYKKLIDYRNTANRFAVDNGINIISIGDGCAEVELAITTHHLNPIGSIHGGCLYTIADTAAGCASSSYGINATTMNTDFHYLRPGLNTKRIVARSHVLKKGRRTIVIQVDIYDQDESQLCTGIFTMMSLGTTIDL